MTRRELSALKKLHKLIVHNPSKVADNKEWYRLARLETKKVKGLSKEQCERVCGCL